MIIQGVQQGKRAMPWISNQNSREAELMNAPFGAAASAHVSSAQQLHSAGSFLAVTSH